MTTSVALASNEADSAALTAVTGHLSELVDTVAAQATALLDASAEGNLEGASSARRDLVLFCRGEILPHVIAEEDTLYAQARDLDETKLAADTLIADHRAIAELIDDLAGATTPLAASAAAHALRVLIELHIDKENDYLLPALAQSGDVSLASGLEQLQRQFAELQAASQGGGCGCGGGGCGCGGGAPADAHGHAAAAPGGGGCGCGGGGCGSGDAHDHGAAAAAPVAEVAVESSGCGSGCGCAADAAADSPVAVAADRPVLDVREIPHHIRHATVFGALDAVRPGHGLELLAPHDPLPLLAQIEERHGAAVDISYLERGPQVWRIALDRRVTAGV